MSAELIVDPARREELSNRLDAVQARIDAACAAAGRDREEVTLIVVTKFFGASDVAALAELGVRDIGESRDQEARAKCAALERGAPGPLDTLRVHMVGQVQSKKARSVARYADVVHSVDRAKLITTLDRGADAAIQSGERAGPLPVTVQVDLAADPDNAIDPDTDTDADALRAAHAGLGSQPDARGGSATEDAIGLADAVAATENLDLAGVMAVAPRGLDDAGLRRAFAALHEVSERIRALHPDAVMISAGMSSDLEHAVQFGATHLRVGSAILGTRPQAR